MEVQVNDKILDIEILQNEDGKALVLVDGKKYKLKIIKIGDAHYTIIKDNKVTNIDLSFTENKKKYLANYRYKSYSVQMIDAEERYLRNRNKATLEMESNSILSVMPGKVVKVLVKKGQKVKKGETGIIVSAMKMESEFKFSINGIVKKIYVKKDQVVESNQVLISVEPDKE